MAGVATNREDAMPTRGTPRHAFRFDKELWDAFTEAVSRDPRRRDVSGVIRDFAAWYARRRGAPAPERPPRQPPAG